MISWMRKEPRIVLRVQKADEFDVQVDYFLRFSIVNRRGDSVVLNSVTLRLGDHSYGSTFPALCWIAFKSFSREIKVAFVGHPEGNPFPILKASKATDSMGSVTFALVDERGAIEVMRGCTAGCRSPTRCPWPKSRGGAGTRHGEP